MRSISPALSYLLVVFGLIGAFAPPELVVAQSAGSRFDSTGLLIEGRRNHTATLMASGEILVIGGKRGDITLASAEIYDPRSGRWRRTSSLSEPRIRHTANRLADGRVLVVGGELAGAVFAASAEIYDPKTETWSATGSLIEARTEHTATVLRSGKVLVVGGAVPGAVRSSAELYDPETGIWESIAPAAMGRFDHTATVLPSGEVLLVGGNGADFVSIASAELFNPETESWRPAGRLDIARRDHTASLLPSAKVLIAGGESQVRLNNDTVTSFPRESEIYDPATSTWSPGGRLNISRANHSATLLPFVLPFGGVLVVGGQGTLFPLPNGEIYNPESDTWTLLADALGTGRRFHTATLLPSGQVALVGGQGLVEDGIALAELFTPSTDSWSVAENLDAVRAGHTANLLPGGEVLVVGGADIQGSITDAIENELDFLFNTLSAGDRVDLFDPETGRWSAMPQLEEARVGHTATLLQSGELLVVGGGGAEERRTLASVELYRPAEGRWSRVASLRTERLGHSATLLPNGRALVAGGVNEDALDVVPIEGAALTSAELYDPDRDRWTRTDSLRVARVGHTATLLPSGKVLVTGGWSAEQVIRQSEIYDPATGTWTDASPMISERVFHTATLLPSGEVLVAGGIPATDAELFDPTTGTWTEAGSLGQRRFFHSASLLRDGRVLLVGGVESGLLSQRILPEAELYDPALRTWLPAVSLSPESRRAIHTATLLPDGGLLVVGGSQEEAAVASVERLRVSFDPARSRPRFLEPPQRFQHGRPLTVTGEGLRGDNTASQGNTPDSSVDFPIVQLRSLQEGQFFWLEPDNTPDFSQAAATLRVSELPVALNPGWHLVTVFTAGMPSAPSFVEVGCDLVIQSHPRNTTAPIGATATFTVETLGGRSFQWQRRNERNLDEFIDIPGASGPSYTTPPITAADSGSVFRVKVSNGCRSRRSLSATLVVEDDEPPKARIIAPNGGDFWLLSTDEQRNTQVVTWQMSDNVRICQVKASLVAFGRNEEGQERFFPLDEPVEATFGPGGACAHPGEGTTSISYRVPDRPPSGRVGSLYKVRVEVTDHAGLTKTAESQNPFFIVQPNNESIKTLILTHSGRLERELDGDLGELWRKLEELADHPQVQGIVLDLAFSSETDELYALWDDDFLNAAEPDPTLANLVLFGCHEPLDERCPGERDGIQDELRDRLGAFPEIESLIVVGDDRIVPFARLQDRTVLFLESNYTSDDPSDLNASLTTRGTTVGQALTADQYLSDDPLATFDVVRPEELQDEGIVFLPDLGVGRLVETPAEIINAIATFISQDGVLDLSALDAETGHKVLVSGYDFLIDSGRRIRERWKDAFAEPRPRDDLDLEPVDGQLLSLDWDENSIEARRGVFHDHLAGNGGEPYRILNPNGHATHHELGVPGLDRFDIQGLPVEDFEFNLAGHLVYGVGCHGGLPVAGSPDPADHPEDLPQKMMASGVQAYIANTGYGWGLLNGVGLSERLVEIFTEELTVGGTVRVGPTIQRAKMLYFMEAARFDDYDAKTLMQWTLFGFPMYSIRTGITAGDDASRSFSEPAAKVSDLPSTERFGEVSVARRIFGGDAGLGAPDPSLPAFLTRVEQRFDFSGDGVYVKFDVEGNRIEDEGCPSAGGCFYELNGLASGTSDVPLQPFFVYDSRLSGTSQHGVLWMGGTYTEEDDWMPLFGELASNGGDGSEHGSTPRKIFLHPRGPSRRQALGGDEERDCRPSDFDINSVVLTTGEAVKRNENDATYSVQRLHRQTNLEVLYFNNTSTGEGNCDRRGPRFAVGPRHRVRGTLLEWNVPVIDTGGGVWRVVAVYTDENLSAGLGHWTPIELADDGTGVWNGRVRVDGPARLTYYLQAVDRRGNVSWLEFEGAESPASGVGLGVPQPVDVAIVPGTADLAVDVRDSPDPVGAKESLVYTIAVSNQGPDVASSLVATISLPRAATLGIATGPGWLCPDELNGVLICTREELSVGEKSEITVVMTAPDRGRLRAEAEVGAVEGDPVAGNNTDSAETRVIP